MTRLNGYHFINEILHDFSLTFSFFFAYLIV